MSEKALTSYYNEHKLTKKEKAKKAPKKSSEVSVMATLDINQLLSQYGKEVERRTIAEMQLHNSQTHTVGNAVDVPFEEVNK